MSTEQEAQDAERQRKAEEIEAWRQRMQALIEEEKRDALVIAEHLRRRP